MAAIDSILCLPGIVLLPTPVDAIQNWLALVRRWPVRAGRIFDVQLVATMLANGVRRIHTFNRSDFDHFPELQVLTPE